MPGEREKKIKHYIRNRCQGSNESFVEFSSKLCEQNLWLNRPLSEEHLVEQMIDNLHPDYHKILIGFRVNSLSDLEKLCCEYETSLEAIRRYQEPDELVRNNNNNRRRFSGNPRTNSNSNNSGRNTLNFLRVKTTVRVKRDRDLISCIICPDRVRV